MTTTADADTIAKLRAKLGEALEFFNDAPNFGLRRDRRRTSYKLASEIEALVAVVPETKCRYCKRFEDKGYRCSAIHNLECDCPKCQGFCACTPEQLDERTTNGEHSV